MQQQQQTQGVAMTDTTRKRSSITRMKDATAKGSSTEQGVGARQGLGTASTRGGGYQDIYIKTGAALKKSRAADLPALDELRRMGLAPVWIIVAEIIGVDGFLRVWHALDRASSLDGGASRETAYIYVPSFVTFLRYQRNRFIAALGQQGMETEAIRRRVRDTLCEDVSCRHIERILGRLRDKI